MRLSSYSSDPVKTGVKAGVTYRLPASTRQTRLPLHDTPEKMEVSLWIHPLNSSEILPWF